MESSMRVAGVFPDRLRHVPHFLESASLKSREGAGSGIVAVGRLSTEKGFDLLIDAMKLLPGEHLTIVGDGPLEQDLRNRALQVAAGRVTFAGRLNHEGVLACLQTARVAAVPSRCYENQPLTVIEAMGVGVAPVVTNLGGAPELVDHGVDGWISEPTSEKLAEALRVPLEDIDLAVAAGKAARARVVRDFDPSLHLSRIFAAYREAGLVAND
jgi:glycosyltransferase involved in cell wall biosynthesis